MQLLKRSYNEMVHRQTKDSGDPCDVYSDDKYGNGVHEVVGTSHISCKLSSHCPVTITSAP